MNLEELIEEYCRLSAELTKLSEAVNNARLCQHNDMYRLLLKKQVKAGLEMAGINTRVEEMRNYND